MKKKFLILILMTIPFISCHPIDDRLSIKNNTNDSLIVRFLFENEIQGEEGYWGRTGESVILPLSSTKIRVTSTTWEAVFEEVSPADSINLVVSKYYILDYFTNKKRDSILQNQLYTYKKFTLKDFKDKNWLIVYPNDGFEGFKNPKEN